MTPIKFTIKNGITHFHYNFSELIDFVRRGKKDGNIGVILTKRDGDILTYRGFGTIENPFTHIVSITMVHFSPFDGRMPSDQERLIPPKSFFNTTNVRYAMISFKK